MILSDVSVRRPVVVAVGAILLILVGVIGFLNLSVREYPETDPPVVSVQTAYTGAAAAIVESRITQPLEQLLAGIDGIESIVSRSEDGKSVISVEFRPGRDVDAAANDVRDRVAGAVEDLPEDALPSEVRKVDADAQPIIFYMAQHPAWSRMRLTDYVERFLVDRFSTIDGVAQVNLSGEARPSMRIWLNPGRLAAYHLTPRDVEAALRSQNVELPAGRIEATQQNVSLRVNRAFTTPAQFSALVIGRGSDGYQVRLGDVARVEAGPENPFTGARANGATGVGMGLVRQSGANTLAVADAAKRLARDLASDLPAGMVLQLCTDVSTYIEEAIKGVWHTLAEAAVLVVLVIFLFLGSWRATLIPAVTVPICLLATFAVLWAFGYSINLLTLLAMVLAIGLVVDDAIVVLENVHHRIVGGEAPLVAAYLGTRQVGFAVISTTLVVCAVFVPVMFIEGQTGLLFRELAVTLISALAISGVLALSLVPMLCSKLLRRDVPGRLPAAIDHVLGRLETRYHRLLERFLRRPGPGAVSVLVLLGACLYVFATLDSELAPPEDTGVVEVRLNAPEGTGFAQLDRYVREAEGLLMPMVGDGVVRNMTSRLPNAYGADNYNAAGMTIFLQPWGERDMTSLQVAQDVTRRLGTITGVRGNATVRSSLGRNRGQPINFVIAGATYPELARARDRIIAAARDNPGLVNVDADYVESKPQLLIDVDPRRAGDLGVSVDDVSQALQTMMGSRRVTSYSDRGREYRVIVQAAPGSRDGEARLAGIYVRGRGGMLVPLSNLVRMRDTASARELGRFNKLRAITIQAGLAPGYALGRALAFFEDQARTSPEVLAVGYRGESQALKQAGGSIWIVFAITIGTIYLLLAAQFESFKHPAVIVTTVPLAIAGGVLGLAAGGMTLNLYSQIGMVMLVGLAAKNGILIVEFANQLRDDGVAVASAAVQASVRRLRPILMTSIATVLGAVPLALSQGAGAGARRAIGVVIVSGLSLSTVMTLFLIPFLYNLLCRGTSSPQATSRRLDAALQ